MTTCWHWHEPGERVGLKVNGGRKIQSSSNMCCAALSDPSLLPSFMMILSKIHQEYLVACSPLPLLLLLLSLLLLLMTKCRQKLLFSAVVSCREGSTSDCVPNQRATTPLTTPRRTDTGGNATPAEISHAPLDIVSSCHNTAQHGTARHRTQTHGTSF